MSKSLSIALGDLNVTGRHYDTVRGKDKLMQDLRCLLIEQVGTDPATPGWGSALDTDSYVGAVYSDALAAEARMDIMALLQGYQAAQLEKLKQETIQYDGLNTFEEGEVIESIDEITTLQVGTTLLVRINLTTVAGDQIRIDVPVDTFSYG